MTLNSVQFSIGTEASVSELSYLPPQILRRMLFSVEVGGLRA